MISSIDVHNINFGTIPDNLFSWISSESPGHSAAEYNYCEAKRLKKRCEEEIRLILDEIQLLEKSVEKQLKKAKDDLNDTSGFSCISIQKMKKVNEAESLLASVKACREKISADGLFDFSNLYESLLEVEEEDSEYDT